MAIFHELKLIHAHNPRCGGTSINKAFASCLNIPPAALTPKKYSYHYLYGLHKTRGNYYELDHLTFAMILDAIPQWVANEYQAFVVVRHPWDRFVSEYTRKITAGCKRFINPLSISFETYCLRFLEKMARVFDSSHPHELRGINHFDACHFLHQYLYAGLDLPESGSTPRPRLIRIQDVNRELPGLCGEHAGAVSAILNRPLNSHRQTIPEERAAQIANLDRSIQSEIETFYAKDYELFGYEPAASKQTLGSAAAD
ncbi:hypothetical protein EVJ50_09420 [Synechococcus sp. RSCCF101]|uniref:sulfotransferase family 2 domain-containing protein n=1 Tax=Synechococcus sp. RSCCF101 TaxID=2511069 RepID=UPI0012474244|nr:sulfotransferase family 2 domain-containing protein [Synechococcus sp. RSCCF101]QEY32400.1 hypothetical protein EVJ50_09420 [Synechococcus sp. RSCCF101]